uniref:Uncharacterized protein n=1 Tax=Candidatus Kentrum eta TaxID=2126337 RepID=A0A450V9I5_9GAMM|nr:MAG: hypothetical protein BECKH772A_GA0070896_102223 [Candidatus Kentron sp. H]VFK01406.1 MAG: hypothetical protein BECKH772B_GA0070898_102303 [Candidatus Kentron sp. H]VFK04972.1 MAG: hypothetical protein BECKH772C_GA0070978_102253 [Candidatus Kentron sp. H]
MTTGTKKRIVGGTVIGIVALLLFINSQLENSSLQQQETGLATTRPWQIEVRPDGLSRVFGITLGETTLGTVQTHFRDGGEMRMFVSPFNRVSVEVFFKSVDLDGIRGKIVLLLDPGEETLGAMLERGTRTKPMPDGGRKISLHPEDRAQLRYTPVGAITYLPTTDLDASVIQQRFGEPERRIPDREAEGVVHWLYPYLGLDIALNEGGKEIFQYVPPREFERLLEGFGKPFD